MRGPNHEDIGYFVKAVKFTLHESFKNAVRCKRAVRGRFFMFSVVYEAAPYETSEVGWGEFTIQ